MYESANITRREKLRALYRVAAFKPLLTTGVIALAVLAALLEGIGLSFILPIIELAQGEIDPDEATGLMAMFVEAYRLVGLPFTLGMVVLGVSAIMVVRFTSSFLVGWLRVAIQTYYVRHLQATAFDHALDAEIRYFDREGSDDILNAIVTQAEYAGKTIRYAIYVVENALLVAMYLAIALYLAPTLTLVTAAVFAGLVFSFRYVLEAGYSIGDRVAEANERIQSVAQAGTQGIHEVKVFGLANDLRHRFTDAVDLFTHSQIKLVRNQIALNKFYNLASAITVFVLIYIAITHLDMSLGALGIFLFAMFRLGPVLSSLNDRLYTLEGQLPHLVRTQVFIRELERMTEADRTGREAPSPVDRLAFEDVSFTYDEANKSALEHVSFAVERGEFVAFVGPSGAGKSTIASLIARLYTPDSGRITANGVPIDTLDRRSWRDRVALVRQSPHIFNDTLRWNVTLGDPDVTEADLERACTIAAVDEFLDSLPEGYDSRLGDEGVRLSGGQRQRVALARAVIRDANLLVLDEATSDLDTRLERRVQAGIESLDREYAIVAIAHRLSTVQNADRIYTLTDGRIEEIGDHGELVAGEGTYAELYEMQSNPG